jgi:hypothetical protein
MCNPASFVVTRNDKVFWSKNTESHEEIIKEFNLSEGVAAATGDANFVRVEINPPENDMRKPLADWVYHLDQDNPPAWYDAKSVEKDCRAELKEWFTAKVITDGQKIGKIEQGQWFIWGGTISAVWGGTISAVWGGTISAVRGGTISEVCGGTISEVWGGNIVAYIKLNKSILKSDKAVLIDRSGKTIKCYVGKNKKA